MSTYFDKKKLLEDNKDLYISNYDKSLNASALSGIIDAKRSYAEAEKAGNTDAMSKANQKANSIRASYGSYDGGTDGSQYNRVYNEYETKKNTSYTSPYEKKIEKLAKEIAEKEDFSYNPESDPVFKNYRDLYTKLGNDAYDRALYENSLRTGGTLNSSAQSAAMQARNLYNTKITEIIPELYKTAYSQYSDEYDRLFDSLNAISSLDKTEYNRYRDKISDFISDRDYYYKKDKDISDALSENYEFETKTEEDRYEFDSQLGENKYEFDNKLAYTKEKDAADAQYTKERDAKDDEYRNKKLAADITSDKLTAAVNIAKAIYGKTAVSRSTINSIMQMIDKY